MRPCLVLCSLFLLASVAWASPSLKSDCDFTAFQTKRMAQERESFWTRTADYEYHDLEQERHYNEELVSQVVDCYRSAATSDLAMCDFASYRFDERKVQQVFPSSEYFYWQVDVKSGQETIYPEKLKYLKMLAGRVASCFDRAHLKNLSDDAFIRLYSTIEVLENISDERYNLYRFLPVYTTEKRIKYAGTKDAETTRYIHLNGLTLVEDDDGVVWLHEGQDAE